MIQSAGVLSLYLLCLFFSGYVVSLVARVQENRLVWALVLSLMIFGISHTAFSAFGQGLTQWWLIFTACTGLFSVVTRLIYRRNPSLGATVDANRTSYQWLCFAGVVSAFSAYHLWVGPYTEIPSDFWSHLGLVVEVAETIAGSTGTNSDSLLESIDNRSYIYFLHAVIAASFGVDPLSLIEEATLAASLVFIAVYYGLSLQISKDLELPESWQEIMAIVSVVLMLLSFGTASFSYIRYYAYFPHIFGMSLVFAGASLLARSQEKGDGLFRYILISSPIFALLCITNNQEALFFAIIVFGMITIDAIRSSFGSSCRQSGSRRLYQARVFLLMTALLVVAMMVVMPARIDNWGFPHILDLSEMIGIETQLLIANPEMRFWSVVAPFGLIVIVASLFFLRDLRGSNFLLFGLVVPFVTVFNPFFVIGFIKLISWDPLYRFAFLIPLPILGAFVLVKFWFRFISSRRGYMLMNAVLATILMIGSLFPWDGTMLENRYSRIPSLYPVDQNNGHKLWADVIKAVSSVEGSRQVITDPVTAYVITNSTMHRKRALQKADWQYDRDPFSGDYQDRLKYYGVDGGLIVFNQRNGQMSSNGKKSGHWREDILRVESKYPSDFSKFLDDQEHFSEIWSGDSVAVYEILRDPEDY